MPSNYKTKYLAIITIVISGYFFLLFTDIFSSHSWCLFKNLTGMPCPSCGSTRATRLLFHGEAAESVRLNPFGIISNFVILISLVWMIRDILKGKESFLPFLKKPWKKEIMLALFFIVSANWIWNIVKGN